MANHRAPDYYTRGICPDCGGKKSAASERCASCAGIKRGRGDPTPEEIESLKRQIREENDRE